MMATKAWAISRVVRSRSTGAIGSGSLDRTLARTVVELSAIGSPFSALATQRTEKSVALARSYWVQPRSLRRYLIFSPLIAAVREFRFFESKILLLYGCGYSRC